MKKENPLVSIIVPNYNHEKYLGLRLESIFNQTYPNYKVIVLNDDFNTFEHVSNCLMKYIPGMTADSAWELTNQVHYEGQATVWVGPQEQAELYHQQLSREGLTMAPLEKA